MNGAGIVAVSIMMAVAVSAEAGTRNDGNPAGYARYCSSGSLPPPPCMDHRPGPAFHLPAVPVAFAPYHAFAVRRRPEGPPPPHAPLRALFPVRGESLMMTGPRCDVPDAPPAAPFAACKPPDDPCGRHTTLLGKLLSLVF